MKKLRAMRQYWIPTSKGIGFQLGKVLDVIEDTGGEYGQYTVLDPDSRLLFVIDKIDAHPDTSIRYFEVFE